MNTEDKLLAKRNRELEAALMDRNYMLDQLRDHLTVLEAPKAYVPTAKELKIKSSTEQEVVMLLSDCQIGELIDSEETGGIGGDEGYNIAVFEKRFNLWKEKVIRIVSDHRQLYPMKTGNLLMLGDILEGRQIFIGQSSRLSDNIIGQFVKSRRIIGEGIRDLSAHFTDLNLTWVTGNHGRVGKRGEDLHYVNWEYLLAQMIQEETRTCKNVHWHVPKTWWTLREIQGWQFYCLHGDTIKRYFGLPYYGIDRADGDTTTMLQQMGLSFDYMVMGHFHTPTMWDRAWGEKIINGSFVTGNPFAAHELRRNTRPTQMIFGVTREQGITWRYPLRLDRA